MENGNNGNIDWKKKCEDLRKIVEEQNRHREASPTEKICPFMSTPEKKVACTPQCRLYRSDKVGSGFVCYLMELRSISWNTKPKNY